VLALEIADLQENRDLRSVVVKLLVKPFVSLVKRRIPIRMVRFNRSM
jgi:hypothetical protein